MKVTIHRVSSKEMHDACASLVVGFGLLTYVEGCAWARLCEKRCDIYLDKDYPDDRILEHELLHCKGHDHVGGDTFASHTARWLADPKAYCEEMK